MPDCFTSRRTMKHAEKSLHFILTSMHLGQLNVTQLDGGWRNICQYWGLPEMLLCIYAIKMFRSHMISAPQQNMQGMEENMIHREHELK